MRKLDQLTLSSITRKLALIDHSKISLCLIAKNCEQWLSACLSTAASLVDEMIVVDRGSADRTVEVAREQQAIVHFLPLNTDFARIRNYALDLAHFGWVLLLEPEETLVLGELSKQQILQSDTDIWLCRVFKGKRHLVQPRLFKRLQVQGYYGDGYEQLSYAPGARIKVLENAYISSELGQAGVANGKDNIC